VVTTMTSTIAYAQPRLPLAGSPFPGDLAHLTSAGDVSREQAQWLFTRAEWMARQPAGRLRQILSGRLLGSLFYQNSTRTRLSFEAAMHRLGGSVIGFDDVRTTRAGDFFAESLPDTIGARWPVRRLHRVAAHRRRGRVGHGRPVAGARHQRGCGANEHPTQALLDVGMLHRLLGDLTGARIGLVVRCPRQAMGRHSRRNQ
jgi:aspartate carbamoyltransferase catalytic subunit